MLKTMKITLFSLLVAAVLTTAFGAGYTFAVANGGQIPSVRAQESLLPRSSSSGDVSKQFTLLDEVYRVLKQDFVDPSALDAEKLGRGAIEGLIIALGDAHTSFIDAETFRAEQSGIRGSYEGIGANVMQIEGVLTIVAPLPGSPAERAGLRPGDKILSVDGVTTQGMSLADAVNKVKGPRGSKVALSVLHQGDASPAAVEIVRAEIRTNSVLYNLTPEGYSHIRIGQFAQRTANEMQDVLKQAETDRAKGIILDLRNNPGGLLDVTVDVTGLFLSGGIAGYQVDRQGHKEELPLRSRDSNKLPMVVLVNNGSASGSELLAGALQDRGRAKLIGTRTFGKGSVNHLRELSDGSALYVTIGRWLTPNGRLIEGNGLSPDMEVSRNDDDLRAGRDPQYERALETLGSQAR